MSFNSQMTALANVIRSKANIQTALSISGMIEAINNLTGEGAQISLGEIDQNGNFQPISFDGTAASASGQAIQISNYYTWNKSSFEYLTPDYTGQLNIQIQYEGHEPINQVLSITENTSTVKVWSKTGNDISCLCGYDSNHNGIFIHSMKEYERSVIYCDAGLSQIDVSKMPFNINLMTYNQAIKQHITNNGPISVIITKVN